MRKNPFRISDKEIVETYLRTHSLRQTALIAQGISSTATIRKKLKSLGIEVKNYKLKPIQISDEELISLYNSGKSLMEIAKIASGSKGAMMIRKRLQELGIDTSYSKNIEKYKEKMSQSFHKYSLNEHIFDTIDTEEKAYWLGFLMADGYNQENKYAICLRLQACDKEILEKFREFLKSDAPIYTIHRTTKVNRLERDYMEVRVNSVYLSKQLAKLGCVQGKTYRIEFPNYLPPNLIHHFIRGYFDGNGCINIRKRNDRKSANSREYQFTICGRKEFVAELQKYLVEGANVIHNKLFSAQRIAGTIHYCGYNVVMRLLNYLYKDATIYLKRKHDKYIEMVTRQSNLQK